MPAALIGHHKSGPKANDGGGKLLNQGVGYANPKLMAHKHSRSQAIACLICRLPGQSGGNMLLGTSAT